MKLEISYFLPRREEMGSFLNVPDVWKQQFIAERESETAVEGYILGRDSRRKWSGGRCRRCRELPMLSWKTRCKSLRQWHQFGALPSWTWAWRALYPTTAPQRSFRLDDPILNRNRWALFKITHYWGLNFFDSTLVGVNVDCAHLRLCLWIAKTTLWLVGFVKSINVSSCQDPYGQVQSPMQISRHDRMPQLPPDAPIGGEFVCAWVEGNPGDELHWLTLWAGLWAKQKGWLGYLKSSSWGYSALRAIKILSGVWMKKTLSHEMESSNVLL